MTSHWLYKGKIIETVPEDFFGFVYLITNLITNRKYIGRKYLGSTRRFRKKGNKNRTVIRKESDWRFYTGSNPGLNQDIQSLGKEKFNFEILFFAKTKGQVNFLEETLQHKHNVLLSDEYYNNCIGPKRFMSVKIEPELKNQLVENLLIK